MNNTIQLYVFILACVCHSMLFAQANHTDDSVVYWTSIENARNKALRIQTAINIGSEYNGFLYNIEKGHQFFLSEAKLTGDILYNDKVYANLSLQYDIIQDEVITEHANGRKMILIKEKITEFTIDGHVFRRLSNVSTATKTKPGFYEVMVDSGELQLLAKREKKLRGQRGTLYYKQEKSSVEDNTKYFLVKNEIFFPVKNYKSIVKILSDNGTVLRLTTREKSSEAKMINIVKQYSSIQ